MIDHRSYRAFRHIGILFLYALLCSFARLCDARDEPDEAVAVAIGRYGRDLRFVAAEAFPEVLGFFDDVVLFA